MKNYASRGEAGKRLGEYLLSQGVRAEVVLGLPRGGVVVAAEVARALRAELDVVVVRKIGHPTHREFAIGAMAEDGTVLLDEGSMAAVGLERAAIEPVIAEERQRLAEYRNKFHHRSKLVSVKGLSVLVVDDGLATGATAEAAVRAVRAQGARSVMLAVPVASEDGLERLAAVCGRVFSPWIDPAFEAVGQYYRDFRQTTDEEVVRLLKDQPH